MKNKTIIIFLLLTYITLTSYAQQKKAEVTYIGNAGFMIKIGDKKILVDALFKGFEGDYNLPEQIQEKLNNAQAPFDDVDLILVTHAHSDHISADMVQQHMKNNPNAFFASTKQTVDALNVRDTIDHFQERRIGFNPSKDSPDKQDINGISIEAVYLPHGPDARIINNGFLVTVNGVTFFHTGDVDFDQFTFEEFRSLQLPERKIDLSFIQHFYLTSDSTSRQFVTKGIGGNYIIPIHYHFTNPGFDAAIVKENYPDAILFDKELESWNMPAKKNDFTNLKGDYFGLTPPGDTPEIFLPEIVSVKGKNTHACTFSPDGKQLYFSRYPDRKSFVMTFENGQWSNPQEAFFNGKETSISSSNETLFYYRDGDIYFNKKTEEGWGNAIDVGKDINTVEMEYYPSVTYDGTLFFSRNGNWDEGRIMYSTFKNGKYTPPVDIGFPVNNGGASHAYVAPDKSYMIFNSPRKGSYTKLDLWISFRNDLDIWTNPQNLGKTINSGGDAILCPTVSPDGKYLFFTRLQKDGTGYIYWVSAKIINRIRN